MNPSYKYVIAQLAANPVRGERLNLAIVVFDDDRLTVHAARNLEKVRVISAAIDREMVEQSLRNLEVLDEILRREGKQGVEQRLQGLDEMSPLRFSTFGQFSAPDADAYSGAVNRLVSQLVEPEPAPLRKRPAKKTRLLTSVKSAFRAENVLARKGEGIDSHRVVANEELAEGLNADLLLKNGAMHVVQTVDASQSDRARRAIQEIGISALVFEQARIKFGEVSTRPRLVYSASGSMEQSISAALHAAEHQGADLINWESRDDRVRFIIDLSSLAEPTEAQQRAKFGAVNASNLRKLN